MPPGSRVRWRLVLLLPLLAPLLQDAAAAVEGGPGMLAAPLAAQAGGGALLQESPDGLVVESSFGPRSVVFQNGRSTPAWSSASPGVWLKSQDNVATFTLQHVLRPFESGRRGAPTLRGVFGGAGAPPTFGATVSDPEVLEAVLAAEPLDPHSSVLWVRHVCKRPGHAKVSILMLQDPQHAHARIEAHGTSKQTPSQGEASSSFAYWKSCNAASVVASDSGGLLSFLRVRQWKLPPGGWAVLLFVLLPMVMAAIIYEAGHVLASYIIRGAILEYGPTFLGCEIEVGNIMLRPWTGAFFINGLTVYNPPGFQGEYLLRVNKIIILMAMRKMVVTCGKEVEFKKFQLKGMDVRIERESLAGGDFSNVKIVQENLKRQQQILEEQQSKQNALTQRLYYRAMEYMQILLERVLMREVAFTDIGAVVELHYPFGVDIQVDVPDLHYKNMSDEKKVKGMSKIVEQFAWDMLANIRGADHVTRLDSSHSTKIEDII